MSAIQPPEAKAQIDRYRFALPLEDGATPRFHLETGEIGAVLTHIPGDARRSRSDRRWSPHQKYIREPLQYSGALDGYEYFQGTPCIGREHAIPSTREMLDASNSDTITIRDLAVIKYFNSLRRLPKNWE
jgi:hypothetical protein